MSTNEYVDLDLYGRGFDGIFDDKKEEENVRQALAKIDSTLDVHSRIQAAFHIDRDRCCRGEPGAFGKKDLRELQGAFDENQNTRLRLLARKINGKMRALKVASRIKALATKAVSVTYLKRSREPRGGGLVPDDVSTKDEVDVQQSLMPVEHKVEAQSNLPPNQGLLCQNHRDKEELIPNAEAFGKSSFLPVETDGEREEIVVDDNEDATPTDEFVANDPANGATPSPVSYNPEEDGIIPSIIVPHDEAVDEGNEE